VKICPACGNGDVRRSFVRPSEAKLHRIFSPYRCRACRHRFWVVSQRARTVAAIACGVCAIGVIGIAVITSLPKPNPGWDSEAALASRAADADAGPGERAKRPVAAEPRELR